MNATGFKSLLSAAVPRDDHLRMEVNPLTLSFQGRCENLEQGFLADYARKSLPQVRLALVLGILFYALFGILDSIMAGESTALFWRIRYAAVCPIILLVLILSYTLHFSRWMQPAVLVLTLVSGAGIIAMTAAGNAMIARTYYVGLILVLMMAYTFIRARFIWATPACLALLASYGFTAARNPDLPPILLISNLFFCITANLIGMLVCYAIEFYARRDFFMSHLLEEEHRKVESAKAVLEQKVEDRTRKLARTNEDLRREILAHQRLTREKKVLEDQLRQAQKMEAVGTLAGGIAHDFNNILAAIMGHTELAMMQIRSPEQAQGCLSEVLRASDRAKDLVGQILAFSRHSDSRLAPLQISLVIKEALRLLRATLPSSIRIEKNLQAGHAIVQSDPTQIHQILMNLCANAAHAMMPQGGLLSVSLREVDIATETLPAAGPSANQVGPGKYVRLRVADTGHGIPANLQERIFDPYFTTKAKGVGTGLGLAVVRGIVQNHGGLITVESTPETGTTFDVYFPRLDGPAAAENRTRQPAKAGRECILLVDDDEGLAELGAKLLTTLGYCAVFHSDPHKALDQFQADPFAFDLVIADMIMPYMNGEALARAVRTARADIPIIIYTGFSDTIDLDALEAAGIREVLRKPITLHSLSVAIRQVLEKN